MRKMPLTASAPPARARRSERRARAVAEAEADDGQAPGGGRQHHRQAVAVDARRPAAGQAGDERADGRRRVEEAQGARRRPASAERAGKSASGMPKTMATKSTT